MIQSIEQESSRIALTRLCPALDVSRSAIYRRRRCSSGQSDRGSGRQRVQPANALSLQEQQTTLDLLNSARFCDQSPREVFAQSLDEGLYLCSVRTMYRVLAKNKQVRERRDQLRHPKHRAPQLVATAPNQVWTWDITKVNGPQKWQYFYLYVILDLYSRFVVGWLASDKQCQGLAKKLIEETLIKHAIEPNCLALHSDRGGPMISKTVYNLLSDLGVGQSFSRPRVSNDNAFSESQFKTLKYCPQFPECFGSLEDLLRFARRFFGWYNYSHHHSGIALLTPADVHQGMADVILEQRHQTMLEAFRKNPARFRNIPPAKLILPASVWINPPEQNEDDGRAWKDQRAG